MRQNSKNVVDAHSAVASFTSNELSTEQVYALSVIVKSSVGTNAGTLKMQGNNKIPSISDAAADWFDIPSAACTIVAGATNGFEKNPICYNRVRFVWTQTAGAGVMTVAVNTQGF